MDIDLRSYFPEFTRSIVLPDGVEYFIRELVDLPVRTFNRIVDDEKAFPTMPFDKRHAIEIEHARDLLVVPVTQLGRAAKGGQLLGVPSGEDLRPGDVVHVNGGLYFERNIVSIVAEDGAVSVAQPWRFDAPEGARVFRAVRSEVLDELTFSEFASVIGRAKTPAEPPADPPKAADESTS